MPIQAEREGRVIALSILNLGSRWGRVAKATLWLLCGPPSRETAPVPIIDEAGWSPWPVQTGMDKITCPTGDRVPDIPARSEALYHLRHPGPHEK
jgi:hypothetical protein